MADTLDKVKPALDPSLYSLDAESLAFLKAEIGIQDDDELKNHILSVQARAYAVSNVPFKRV
jgi:hypothetical protein